MLHLGKELMLFDGGMGSEIEKRGIFYTAVEDLNITHSSVIKEIHASYKTSDFVTTNTFGLNSIKYKGSFSIKEVCDAAVENARSTGKKVFFDIGPTGSMLKPIGTLSFDAAFEAFKEIVLLSRDKVDGYIAETFSDIYELKACILAIKENSDKPVFATMTFDKSERTLTGTSPEIMVDVLEGLGVDALGFNCSLGPNDLRGVFDRIAACAHIPIIVQPNAGLPTVKNGKTSYLMSAAEFAESVKYFAKNGAAIIGGCCGTTPEFIDALAPFKGMPVKQLDNSYKTTVSSFSKRVCIDGVKICGERLNPTGKKRIKEAIATSDYDALVLEAVKQQDAGADLLDINVGVPKIDEPSVMRAVVEKVQEFCDLPVQIDSSNKEAIEQGVRYCNGLPLINSVNGEMAVMEAIFPIAKKYGAVVLGLTLDENGIPKTAEQRFEIAKRIVKTAEKYGIPRHKIMIDTLVLTASAEQSLVSETLKALTLVKTLGVQTALGVSNVSFGLPNRPLINKTFLTMAMQSGLNMPILNPLDTEMMNAVKAYCVLANIDKRAEEYIEAFADDKGVQTVVQNSEQTLADAIKKGLKNEAAALAEKELEKALPIDIINNTVIPALGEIGELFGAGKVFLPQLISSAEAAKEAFDKISERLPARTIEKGTVLVATVKGDVHDIGKNIVKTVLSSYGYSVIDLGKDVTSEIILDAYKKHKPIAVGLSALMTTTVASMEATVKALKECDKNAKVMVGGAVLTEDIAKEIGADYYAPDALCAVEILENLR